MVDEADGADGLSGYLRAYDDDLDGALELVVADLATAGISREEALTRPWGWVEFLTDGGPSMLGGEIAVWILETEQARLIEDLRSHVWPPCPEHPRHPLWIGGPGPGAAWCCPRSGGVVARLGELGC